MLIYLSRNCVIFSTIWHCYIQSGKRLNKSVFECFTLLTFGLALDYYHHFKLYHDLQGQNFLLQLSAGLSKIEFY